MNNIYKNIEEYNASMKRKTLILFDDMIADMLSNEKLTSNYSISFFLSHNLISLFQKWLDYIQQTILL